MAISYRLWRRFCRPNMSTVLGGSQCCRDQKIRIAVSTGDGLVRNSCRLCTVLRRTTIWGREIWNSTTADLIAIGPGCPNLKVSGFILFFVLFCFVLSFVLLLQLFGQWVWLWCCNRRGTPVGLCYSCVWECVCCSWGTGESSQLIRKKARASSRLGLRAGCVHAVVRG